MGQKNGQTLMVLQKNVQDSLKKPEAKEACLQLEYKLLLLYSSQFGIYIMPQLENISIWHGIIFVRYGIYKDARYKFCLFFENFPQQPPRVQFMSKVWHPMVDLDSGELDLADIARDWNYGTEHLIFTVVQHIRIIFMDVKKYQVQSHNNIAMKQFKDNVEQFFLKVRSSVESSKNQIYANYQGTSLKFSPFNEKHRKIRQGLSLICEDHSLTAEDKKKKFMKLLKK